MQALGQAERGEKAAAEGIVADALQARGEGDRGDACPLAIIPTMPELRNYLPVHAEVAPIIVRLHHLRHRLRFSASFADRTMKTVLFDRIDNGTTAGDSAVGNSVRALGWHRNRDARNDEGRRGWDAGRR